MCAFIARISFVVPLLYCILKVFMCCAYTFLFQEIYKFSFRLLQWSILSSYVCCSVWCVFVVSKVHLVLDLRFHSLWSVKIQDILIPTVFNLLLLFLWPHIRYIPKQAPRADEKDVYDTDTDGKCCKYCIPPC